MKNLLLIELAVIYLGSFALRSDMFFGRRDIECSLRCPQCQNHLLTRRGCREVRLYCPTCNKFFELSDFSENLDDMLEDYLGNVPCDRI